MTAHGELVVTIKTVAFLRPTQADQALTTTQVLTIELPSFDPAWLEGATIDFDAVRSLAARDVTPVAERENAEQAAEDDLFQRPPTRRCLTCGGPLQVVTVPSAYQVICVDEQRVLLKARGI